MEDSYLAWLCVSSFLCWGRVLGGVTLYVLLYNGGFLSGPVECVIVSLLGRVWDGVTLYVLIYNGGFLSDPVECVIVSLFGKSMGWCDIVRSTP